MIILMQVATKKDIMYLVLSVHLNYMIIIKILQLIKYLNLIIIY